VTDLQQGSSPENHPRKGDDTPGRLEEDLGTARTGAETDADHEPASIVTLAGIFVLGAASAVSGPESASRVTPRSVGS
jgi:hypothetical protein